MSASDTLDRLNTEGIRPAFDDEPKYHELSTVFMSFEDTNEFEGLVISVKKYGLFEPILMWQGWIVDGRHRHKACLKSEVEPEYEYLPDDMPFNVVRDRVVAANLMRRHLTTGQRAMTAAALANMTVGRNWESNRPNSANNKSNKDAGDQLNVGKTAVKTAKDIKRDAPDLAEKVKKGEMTLNAADTERRKRQGLPEKTNAPKPKGLELDTMMKVGGKNWNSMVSAGSLVSTARDLYLQDGEKGMGRSIMQILESGEGKHSQSYNAMGLIALYNSLGSHLSEIEELLLDEPDTASMN
tara:strand:- start:481 stop:1371 length:891 start_codon:yes stop_codon:yes gene_type:complete